MSWGERVVGGAVDREAEFGTWLFGEGESLASLCAAQRLHDSRGREVQVFVYMCGPERDSDHDGLHRYKSSKEGC